MIKNIGDLTVVEFGHGTTMVVLQDIKTDDSIKPIMSFYECEKTPLGILKESNCKTDIELGCKVRLAFAEPEAIDRFINDLVRLKDHYTKGKYVHVPSFRMGLQKSIVKITTLYNELEK